MRLLLQTCLISHLPQHKTHGIRTCAARAVRICCLTVSCGGTELGRDWSSGLEGAALPSSPAVLSVPPGAQEGAPHHTAGSHVACARVYTHGVWRSSGVATLCAIDLLLLLSWRLWFCAWIHGRRLVVDSALDSQSHPLGSRRYTRAFQTRCVCKCHC